MGDDSRLDRVPEAALRFLIGRMPALTALIDRDRRIVWISRFDGRSTPDALGLRVEQFLPEVARESAIQRIERAFESGERSEELAEAIGLDGKPAGWFRVHLIPVPSNQIGEPGVFLVATDETERVESEARVRRSEARLRAIVAGSPDFICVVNRELKVTFLSHDDPAGPSRDEVLQLSVGEITHADDRDLAVERVLRVFETGEPETYLARSAMQAGTFEIRALPLADEQVLLFVRDITALTEADQRLVESERRLALSARAGSVSFWEWFPARDEIRLSDVVREHAGLQETVGVEPYLGAIHIEDRERVRAAMRAVGEGAADTIEVEYRIGDADAWLLGRGAVVARDVEGAVRVLGCTIDITERKHAEAERAALAAQLQHAQRLESVGQLAGGVAHDFNNLLQVLRAELSLLEMKLDSDHADEVASAQQAVDRAAELTSHLLTFARRQSQSPRAARLDEVVARVAGMLARVMPENIVIDTAQARDPAPVFADVGQLEQVLTNLCVNARDAMPGGGKIAISILPITRDGAEMHGLVVEDEGSGFEPAAIERAAEPFFTTKPVGEGTGLGLSVVHGIAQAHGGVLEITNRPEGGARVLVGVPETHAKPPPPRVDRVVAPRRRHGRILVAEDDAGVRRVTIRVLQGAGFTVEGADDGPSALAKWRDHGPFDLVLLDARMPGITGRSLAERLRADQPGLPIVFVSGYNDEVLPAEWLQQTGLELLQKPYGVERLLGAVDRALKADA